MRLAWALLLVTVAAPAAAVSPSRRVSVAREAAHPIHSSVTEIALDERRGTATVTVRLWADDFLGALGLDAAAGLSAPAFAPAACAYLVRALRLTDRTGRPLGLRWAGVRRTGDLLLVTFLASAPSGLDGLRVANSILGERFRDQINVVQASAAGRRASRLFTRGDGVKPLF